MDMQNNIGKFCDSLGLPTPSPEEPLSATLFLTVMQKICGNNEILNQMVEVLESRVTALEGYQDSYDSYSDEVDRKITRLLRRVEELEEPGRKRSFIISGLVWPESISAREVVTTFIHERFATKPHIEKVLPLRVAKKFRVQLRDLADKAIIVSKRGSLKGTNIYINDDLTAEERANRRVLVTEFTKAREAH
ncbi:unnamed protein product [Allacma fusca]|uniref:Uncharacterized protein n=1 Tax=Allacma fusca TaxID=39272 RepID=A0A8J2J8E5_9HEXA|nr:unnamed protein product [Allacma fusca]